MIEQSPFHFRFLDSLKFLVLDEYDQLLNETILPEVMKIIEKIPKDRQTLFFSATINYKIHTEEFFKPFYSKTKPNIYDLTIKKENNKLPDEKIKLIDIKNIKNVENLNEMEEFSLNDPDKKDENEENEENEENQGNIISEIAESKKIVKNLTQNFLLVPNNTKEHYLINLLLNEFKKKYIIVFLSSCKRCHFISLLLQLFNLRVSTIHSKMPQKKRFENLENFKNKKNNILVSTDIASRGLDIQNVIMCYFIFNLDL